jgi:hypothetical protein
LRYGITRGARYMKSKDRRREVDGSCTFGVGGKGLDFKAMGRVALQSDTLWEKSLFSCLLSYPPLNRQIGSHPLCQYTESIYIYLVFTIEISRGEVPFPDHSDAKILLN